MKKVECMRRIRVMISTLKEGFVGIWKNRSMGLASLTTISLALLILGSVIISMLTMNQAVKDIEGKVNLVNVYLENGIQEDKTKKIEQFIKQKDGIKDLKYVSNKQAMENFSKSLDDKTLIEGMESAFPASFEITLKNVNDAEQYVREFQKIDGVEKVSFYKDLIAKISNASRIVKYAGSIVVAILVMISIINISNTIRLTVYARRKEIAIKKNIGASNLVISAPLVVEGIFFGIIGAVVAFLACYYLYRYGYLRYNKTVYGLISTYLVPPVMIRWDLLKIFISLGIGIGAFGSVLSSKKYLKI